jgi:hypothetical protein
MFLNLREIIVNQLRVINISRREMALYLNKETKEYSSPK